MHCSKAINKVFINCSVNMIPASPQALTVCLTFGKEKSSWFIEIYYGNRMNIHKNSWNKKCLGIITTGR